MKLWRTFIKDLLLSVRGWYFYIETIMAAVFAIVMLVLVTIDFTPNQVFHLVLDPELEIRIPELIDTLRKGAQLPALSAEPEASKKDSFFNSLIHKQVQSSLQDARDGKNKSLILHDNYESMIAALKKSQENSGAVLSLGEHGIELNLVLQGHESEQNKNFIKQAIEGFLLRPNSNQVIVHRNLESERATPHLLDTTMPVYLTMNIALMGLFIIAAYIFLDKDEGVIRAFAVAPGEIWHYLASKTLIMALQGLISSIPVVLILLGSRPQYVLLVAAIISFNLFGSSLGLLIASFFNTMVKAMGALYGCIMIMMIPLLAYFVPAFSPWWITLFPTYPMLFAFREILNPGRSVLMPILTIIGFLGLAGLLFSASVFRYKRSLTT